MTELKRSIFVAIWAGLFCSACDESSSLLFSDSILGDAYLIQNDIDEKCTFNIEHLKSSLSELVKQLNNSELDSVRTILHAKHPLVKKHTIPPVLFVRMPDGKEMQLSTHSKSDLLFILENDNVVGYKKPESFKVICN